MRNPIMPLGTKTKYGTIEAVGSLHGERYYWMVDKLKCVSMIPAFMIEEDEKNKKVQTLQTRI